MKNWWAGDSEDKKDDGEEGVQGGDDESCSAGKPPLSPGKSRVGQKTEGVVRAQAETLTAPFRNRLIGLLSSIEKEASDYKLLKEKISEENVSRREEKRRSVRAKRGIPQRSVGEKAEES